MADCGSTEGGYLNKRWRKRGEDLGRKAAAVNCVCERGYEMLSWKQNARGLASKNVR